MVRDLRVVLCLALSLMTVGTLPQYAYAHGLHLSIGKAKLEPTAFSGKLVFNRGDFLEAVDVLSNEIVIYDLTADELERMILRYMKRHLKVEANGSTDLKLEITKAGQGNETMWMEFLFTSSDSIEQIKVEHRVLFNAFPDQGNVMEVKTASGKQSHLFKIEDPVAVFKL